MNKKYPNKNFRIFLKKYIKSQTLFADEYGYNRRNMRRWLFYENLFPRPPAIALLVEQISEFYRVPLVQVVMDCHVACREDMKLFELQQENA